MSVRILAAIVLTVSGLGCTRGTRCTTGHACGPSGSVCQPSGRCAPLVVRGEARFARPLRLDATDWAIVSGEEPGQNQVDTDEWALDNETTLYVTFTPPNEPIRVVRAWLMLFPHSEFTGISDSIELSAHRATAYRSSMVTARTAPQPSGPALAEAAVARDSQQPVIFDVTETLRMAVENRLQRLDLTVLATGPDDFSPIRFASPRSQDPKVRPHLSLLVR